MAALTGDFQNDDKQSLPYSVCDTPVLTVLMVALE